MPEKQPSFYDVLTAAVTDMIENGFDSTERVAFWVVRIREAALAAMIPEAEMERLLRERLADQYRRSVDAGGMLKDHKNAQRFTIEKVRPALRAELDRAIYASASLIQLNRRAATEKTLQRFQGWAMSIPKGGSDVASRSKAKDDIRKSLAQLPYEERRVLIDQGHKFASNLSAILATDGGAIAGIWRHHHVTYPRPEHVDRDGDVYLIRDSWADKAGLVKPARRNGYTDDIEKPGELVFCRCTYQYLYRLRDLPPDMLTKKGKDALADARKAA